MKPNLIIIQILHSSDDIEGTLRMYWDNMTAVQKKEIFHFLFISDQLNTFIAMFQLELKQKAEILPWTHFFDILTKSKRFEKRRLDPLLQIEISQEEYGIFATENSTLNELWKKKKHYKKSQYQEKRETLITNFQFAKQQGLQEQRQKHLKDLTNLFPNDKEIQKLGAGEQEVLAREIIQRLTKKHRKYVNKEDSSSAEEKKTILTSIEVAIKQSPSQKMDFIVLLAQLGMHQEAMELLNYEKSLSEKELWYQLIFSIEAKRFAESLSLIALLKIKCKKEDQTFSLMYYEAIALYNLDRKHDAIKLIQYITKIRPNFKSATSLLLEWNSDL